MRGGGSDPAPVNGIIPDLCPGMDAPWLRDHSFADLIGSNVHANQHS